MCTDYAKSEGRKSFIQQLIANVAARVKLAREVRRERRALRQLDDRLLIDIGRDRRQANEEANRAAWDLPQRRLPPSVDRPQLPQVSPIGFMRPMS